jgi:hypothetical protein
LGPGSSALLAPVSARAAGSLGPNVGGQLILKAPRVGIIQNFWVDPSTLGVVCSFDVKMGGADLRIVSLYIPPEKGAISAVQQDEYHALDPVASLDGDFTYRGKLTARLRQFTEVYQHGKSPAEYILALAQNRMNSHLEVQGSSAICVGDFNANGTFKKHQSVNGHIFLVVYFD